MSRPLVSVIVATYNQGATLRECIESIFANVDQDFELIVVDDASTDETQRELSALHDRRLRVLTNQENRGPAFSRNLGASLAKGKYLFFCDSDCFASPVWISAGLDAFRGDRVVAVEGRLLFPPHRPTIRDRFPVNPFYNNLKRCRSFCGDFPSLNIAYEAEAFSRAGGFNATRYPEGREDTDLGWRLQRAGKIAYCRNMAVRFASQRWDWKSLRRNAKRYEKDVFFYGEHGEFQFRWGRILHPRLLTMLLVPPYIFSQYRFSSWRDVGFVFPFYGYLWLVRFYLWRGAIREKMFVL